MILAELAQVLSTLSYLKLSNVSRRAWDGERSNSQSLGIGMLRAMERAKQDLTKTQIWTTGASALSTLPSI